VTTLDTGIGGSESYPSVGLGGGVKLEFSEFIGLRFDGRFIFTDLQEERYDCCYNREQDTLTQLLVSLGLQFKF
jgi:hypothetical protein